MGASGRVITTADILNGTIQGIDIANGTMLDQNFVANSISGSKLQNASVTGLQLADNSVGGTDIAFGTMLDSNFPLNSIHGNKLQNGSVSSLQIVDNTIVNSDILRQTIRGGIDAGESRIALQTIYGPVDMYPGGIFNPQIAAQTIRGGVDGGASRIVPASLNYQDIAAAGVTVVAAAIGSAAFATSGANAWVADVANMPITFDLATACLVTAHCVVPMITSSAPATARFGILRYGIDATPQIFFRHNFLSGGAGSVSLVPSMWSGNLAAGRYTLCFAMSPETGGWTLSVDTTSYRWMVVYAHYR
jgi:hypothetical protein